MKLLKLSWLILIISLSAQTNYYPKYKTAWEPLGKIHTNSHGYLLAKNGNVVYTRLQMWAYFFDPHPYNNRYNDELLDLESQIEYKNSIISDWQKIAKKWRILFIVLAVVNMAVFSVFIIIRSIKNRSD